MFRDAVKAALDAVAEMPADDPLRAIAFQEVLRASLAGTSAAGSRASGAPSLPTTRGTTSGDIDTSAAQRLAARLGVHRGVVDQVFDFEGDTPALIVSPSRLPDSNAAAMQQIALLVCAGRQGGAGETVTSADAIRKVCDEFGRYDAPNFAAKLRVLGGLLIPEGTTRARGYRLTRPGYERVRSLLESLAAAR